MSTPLRQGPAAFIERHPQATVWALMLAISLVVHFRPPRDFPEWDFDTPDILATLEQGHLWQEFASWWRGDWILHNGFYRPLTSTSLLLDYLLWGEAPQGYFLTSFLLFVWTAVTLSALGRELFGRWRAGVIAGAAFAAFGAIDIIIWPAARTDGLCTLAYLGACLYWLRHLRTGRGGAAATALFAVGMLSKEMAITLPAVCLLLALATGPHSFRRAGTWLCAQWVLLGLYIGLRPTVLGLAWKTHAALMPFQPASAVREFIHITFLWATQAVDGFRSVPLSLPAIFLVQFWALLGRLALCGIYPVLVLRAPLALVVMTAWTIIAYAPVFPNVNIVAIPHFHYLPLCGHWLMAGLAADLTWTWLTERRKSDRQTD